MRILTAAIVAFALSIPLTALIWQAGHLRRRLVWHTNQTEVRREAQHAEHQRWVEADAARRLDNQSLKAEFEKLQAQFNVIQARLESGRTEVKR